MDAATQNSMPAARLDPRWLRVFARLMKTEGGFVDSPSDHGGATNYGLSLRYLAQQAAVSPSLVAEVDINHDGVIGVLDIRGMTLGVAGDVYFRFFWLPAAALLPAPFDAAVFDQTVNDGLTPAVKMLQRAINRTSRETPIAVDGVLGAATRTALNVAITVAGSGAVLDAYRAEAAARYQMIATADPTQKKFLAGWLNRAAELGNV